MYLRYCIKSGKIIPACSICCFHYCNIHDQHLLFSWIDFNSGLFLVSMLAKGCQSILTRRCVGTSSFFYLQISVEKSFFFQSISFWWGKLLTFFRVSGGTAIGGGDPRQTVRPVEGAGTGGQGGARVGRGGGSADCGNGGGGRRRPVALVGREGETVNRCRLQVKIQ